MVEIADYSKENVIKSWFDYDKNTGEITWKEYVSPDWYRQNKSHLNFLRDRAGNRVKFSQDSNGHLYTRVRNIRYIYAHQIVWTLTYGKMPVGCIDHIDGDPHNNAIGNLRDVSRKLNNRNAKMPKNNTSGVTNVSWQQHCKMWRVRIKTEESYKHIGYYTTIEDATEARDKFIAENPNLGYTSRHGMK